MIFNFHIVLPATKGRLHIAVYAGIANDSLVCCILDYSCLQFGFIVTGVIRMFIIKLIL